MKTFATFIAGIAVGAVLLLVAGPGRAPDVTEPPVSASESAERSTAPAAATPSPLDEQTVRREFFKLWRQQARARGGIWKSTWFGIKTLQNPLDVWITQEILSEVRPDFVVEAGSFMGGSAAMWATILQEINPEGRVISIDIEDNTSAARELPIVQRKVDFLLGSSTDPAIVAEVARRVSGKPVLVVLDSLHTRDHVRAELEAYAPLVPVGSYIIVQDTGIGEPAYGFDWAADGVRDFLAQNGDFEADASRERFLVTNNPGGFLKRVR